MERTAVWLVLILPLVLFVTAQSSADDSGLAMPGSSSGNDLTIDASSGRLVPSEQKLSIDDDSMSSPPSARFTNESSSRLTVEDEGSQGLQIDRLTRLNEGEIDTLGGGPDWSSFNEYLPEIDRASRIRDDQHVRNRIHWLTPNGFSVALESMLNPSFTSVDQAGTNGQIANSASVLLSWQPDQNGKPGDYRISAIGTRLNLNSGPAGLIGNSTAGWGLDLQGNWEIGDLVAALSVTYGKGIDTYTLRRDGRDLYVTAGRDEDPSTSYSIQPSLYYALNDRSKFHVVLGRHQAENYAGNTETPDQTLDTLHLQYAWSPWPKTDFGLTISREDREDALSGEGNSMILLEGSRKF